MTGCLKKHPVFSLMQNSYLSTLAFHFPPRLKHFVSIHACFNQKLCLHSSTLTATDESHGGLSCHLKSKASLRIAEEENHHAKAAVGRSRSLVWDVRCYPNYLRARAG